MGREPELRFQIIPGLSIAVLARRVTEKVRADKVFGRAAELAYFFLFSLFPLLFVLTSLLGLVSSGALIRGELLRYFRTVLPWSAYELIVSTLREVTDASGGGSRSELSSRSHLPRVEWWRLSKD